MPPNTMSRKTTGAIGCQLFRRYVLKDEKTEGEGILIVSGSELFGSIYRKVYMNADVGAMGSVDKWESVPACYFVLSLLKVSYYVRFQ